MECDGSGPTIEPVSDRLHDPDCLLCKAERISTWYHEDDVCWIADCLVCLTPMVVWRGHGTEPPMAEREHMLVELDRVTTEVIGPWWLDDDMRTIPDHFHMHGRPKDKFFGPGGGVHRKALL